MISDNGGEFTAKLSGLIYDMYGYKHITITPYNPQANGKCERYNKTLKNMLNKTSVMDGNAFFLNVYLHTTLLSMLEFLAVNTHHFISCTGETQYYQMNNV